MFFCSNANCRLWPFSAAVRIAGLVVIGEEPTSDQSGQNVVLDPERTIIRVLWCSSGDARLVAVEILRSRRSRGAEDLALSVRVCITEARGVRRQRGIASRSLFAVDL